MVSLDGKVAELEGKDLVEEVIVVSPQVDHFGICFGYPFHDQFEEGGMMFFPLPGFSKLPAVDDIAIKNELVAGMVPEEVDGFAHPGILDPQVDIGQNDGFVVCFQGKGFYECQYQVFP